MTARWVLTHLGIRNYPWPQCRYCGIAKEHDCPPATCLLCGTVQCFYNGPACKVCRGYIPGWSRSTDEKTCGRKGCDKPSVAKAARVGQVCIGHAASTKVRVGGESLSLVDYAARQVAHRDSGEGWERWRYVEAVA